MITIRGIGEMQSKTPVATLASTWIRSRMTNFRPVVRLLTFSRPVVTWGSRRHGHRFKMMLRESCHGNKIDVIKNGSVIRNAWMPFAFHDFAVQAIGFQRSGRAMVLDNPSRSGVLRMGVDEINSN